MSPSYNINKFCLFFVFHLIFYHIKQNTNITPYEFSIISQKYLTKYLIINFVIINTGTRMILIIMKMLFVKMSLISHHYHH